MAKQSKEPSGEEQAMKPEMRDLILSFEAKEERREEDGKKSAARKQRRRRGDKPARAA